jgi:hypothetical protein
MYRLAAVVLLSPRYSCACFTSAFSFYGVGQVLVFCDSVRQEQVKKQGVFGKIVHSPTQKSSKASAQVHGVALMVLLLTLLFSSPPPQRSHSNTNENQTMLCFIMHSPEVVPGLRRHHTVDCVSRRRADVACA